MSDAPKVNGTLTDLAELLGISKERVSAGVRSGKLPKTAVRDSATGRYVGVTNLVDAAVEWRRNTDLAKVPPPQYKELPSPPELADVSDLDMGDEDEGGITLANASAQERLWTAKKKRLEYLQVAGKLVPAADVEREVTDMIVACKTRLLAVPSRAKQALPHLTLDDLAMLESVVREALEELARAPKTEKTP